jgi:hypothetical protein
MDTYTVQLNPFSVEQDKEGERDVTEADIERAIAEIQAAIQKYSK